MPSYWTSDASLAQIQARIRLDPTLAPDERRIHVPLTVFDVLRQSALRRQHMKGQAEEPSTTNGEMYASIRIDSNDYSHPCVVLATLTQHQADDCCPLADALPICRVPFATWSAITNYGRASQAIDAAADLSVAAVLELIEPASLTEAVFGVGEDQFSQAMAMQDQISAHIRAQTPLLYHGYTTRIDAASVCVAATDLTSPIVLRCLMCQPVAQGLLQQKGDPRIIITKCSSSDFQDPSVDFVPIADTEQWDLDADGFILGDSPLGSSLAMRAGAKTYLQPSIKRSKTATAVCLAVPVDNVRLVPGISPGEDLDNRGFMSLASLARAGIVSGSWVLIETGSETATDDVLATESPVNKSDTAPYRSQRAIRVFGCDDIYALDTLALPPVLFANVCLGVVSPEEPQTYPSKPMSAVPVVLTPFGLPPKSPSPSFLKRMAALDASTTLSYQPPLEIARKVCIARVSSPLTERRDLEPHALAALQEWLSTPLPILDGGGNPLRVVKSGDLLAVRVSIGDADMRTSVALALAADGAGSLSDGNSGAEADVSNAAVNPVSDIAIDSTTAQHRRIRAAPSSELAFYKIVKVEGFRGRPSGTSLLSPDEYDGSSDSDTGLADTDDEMDYEFVNDGNSADPLDREWALWYARVRNAGFVVQPDVAMVVQSGAVHSYVPYCQVGAYADASRAKRGTLSANATSTDTLAIHPYANVLAQLLRLSSTSLHPLALSHGLSCAILLKGSPGTGKRHLVCAMAEQLGVHLYELDCYDILSESEDKAAQVLHVYFQNASRYTPCVMHLRSIDALAQASSTQSGQENAEDLPISRVLKKCLADVRQAHLETQFPIIVVASTSQPDKLPTSLATVFYHEAELAVPDERTRLALLTDIAKCCLPLAPDTDMAYVAQQTASFVARDLDMLVKRAEGRAWRRLQTQAAAETSGTAGMALCTRDLLLSGQMITREDLLGALADARASMSASLGVPKIPNVKWEDVGGLADAKKDILDTIRLPMEQPHLFANGLTTRSGLLFYGPPGTGKTLLAKAIATECGLNFFSCKGPELISPYIGESEANVRRIFQRAREASPCVIFFDELDSLAPKRGQHGDSGGVMDRIVSQLLAELDGMSGGIGGEKDKSEDAGDNSSKDGDVPGADSGTGAGAAVQVFAIGATNRPDLLDPALLRPGRFDKLVYLGVSETHDAQLNIIQALTRRFHLHPDLDLSRIAEQCPFHYTGADFYALCSDALLKAMMRTVDEVDTLVKKWNDEASSRDTNASIAPVSALMPESDAGPLYLPVPMTPQYYLDHVAPESVKQVTVTELDFETALDELIPSVSADELVRYQVLRRQFDSVLKGKSQVEHSSVDSDHGQDVDTLVSHLQSHPLMADDRVSPSAQASSNFGGLRSHILDEFAGESMAHQPKSRDKGKEPEM